MNDFITEDYINHDIERLKVRAKSFGPDVLQVCKPVLHGEGEFKQFPFASGSSKPNQHHYGIGGLSKHVREVTELCLLNCTFYEPEYEMDRVELFLAAFFHDLGKLYDYRLPYGDIPANGDLSLPHKRMIHHISRSGIIWSELAKRDEGIYEKYFESVLHAILAHHTTRLAGSPVAPKSRIAWMVTLCDNMSARMFDAETFDVVKYNG